MLKKLDARLRGHDGKNSPIPQLIISRLFNREKS
jgi:hypothetical protein